MASRISSQNVIKNLNNTLLKSKQNFYTKNTFLHIINGAKLRISFAQIYNLLFLHLTNISR